MAVEPIRVLPSRWLELGRRLTQERQRSLRDAGNSGASYRAMPLSSMRAVRLVRMRYLTQLLDRMLERALSVAVVLPSSAFRQ